MNNLLENADEYSGSDNNDDDDSIDDDSCGSHNDHKVHFNKPSTRPPNGFQSNIDDIEESYCDSTEKVGEQEGEECQSMRARQDEGKVHDKTT